MVTPEKEKEFLELLRKIINSRFVTIKEVAGVVGRMPQTIKKWLAGKSRPRYGTIKEHLEWLREVNRVGERSRPRLPDYPEPIFSFSDEKGDYDHAKPSEFDRAPRKTTNTDDLISRTIRNLLDDRKKILRQQVTCNMFRRLIIEEFGGVQKKFVDWAVIKKGEETSKGNGILEKGTKQSYISRRWNRIGHVPTDGYLLVLNGYFPGYGFDLVTEDNWNTITWPKMQVELQRCQRKGQNNE